MIIGMYSAKRERQFLASRYYTAVTSTKLLYGGKVGLIYSYKRFGEEQFDEWIDIVKLKMIQKRLAC